ncbi:hypothetical protein ZWY2020_022142 [Hordeum vulgare]|nr:hypothetical protein ZWY2020_022142 [Hordeum vulgare]
MASVVVLAAAAACCYILLASSVSSASSMPVVYSVGNGRVGCAGRQRHRDVQPLGQEEPLPNFKYEAKDSVLLVNHDDYKMCSTVTPVTRFADGDTKFKFDRRASSTSSAACGALRGGPADDGEGRRALLAGRRSGQTALRRRRRPRAQPQPQPQPGGLVPGIPPSSYGSSSGGSTSATGFDPARRPSPVGRPGGLSIVTGLVAGVVTMIALA